MLAQIEFENFRCFERHTLVLRPLTIIVGRNNAGKSTVTEGVSLSAVKLAREIQRGEIDAELVAVMSAIPAKRELPN